MKIAKAILVGEQSKGMKSKLKGQNIFIIPLLFLNMKKSNIFLIQVGFAKYST